MMYHLICGKGIAMPATNFKIFYYSHPPLTDEAPKGQKPELISSAWKLNPGLIA